jgi:hypothetical protein
MEENGGLPLIILPTPPSMSPIGAHPAPDIEAEESGDVDALRSVRGHHCRGRCEAKKQKQKKKKKGRQGSVQAELCILWRGRPEVAVPHCPGVAFHASSSGLGIEVLYYVMTWGSRTQRLQLYLAASKCTVTI